MEWQEVFTARASRLAPGIDSRAQFATGVAAAKPVHPHTTHTRHHPLITPLIAMTGRRVQAPAWLEQLRSDRRAWAAAAALLFLAAWGSLAGGGRGTRWSPGRFPCSRPDGWWERLQSNLSAEVATAGQVGGLVR